MKNALTESYSTCFPERVVRFNKKNHKKTPWITAGILKSINHRNKFHKNLKQTQIDAINYVAKKANPPLYPPISINEDTLNKSVHNFSKFLKAEFLNSYANIICSQPECYVCADSN